MAANKQGFVLVYCATSLPSPTELEAYDGPLAARFRNGRFFDPADIELKTMPGGVIVSEVYTNNSQIKEAYEALKGERVKGGAQYVALDIPVHAIAPPLEIEGLPTEDALMDLTRKQLVEQFGVSMHKNKRLRRKADMVEEILQG